MIKQAKSILVINGKEIQPFSVGAIPQDDIWIGKKIKTTVHGKHLFSINDDGHEIPKPRSFQIKKGSIGTVLSESDNNYYIEFNEVVLNLSKKCVELVEV